MQTANKVHLAEVDSQDAPCMDTLRVGLGTSIIEPGRRGGRLDGIGVYTDALMRHLGPAGCRLSAWSYPHLRHWPGAVRVGRELPRSFEAAVLADLLTPRNWRMPVAADIFHATDYRVARMNGPVVATLHDALPIKYPHWCDPRLRRAGNWLRIHAARKADHVIALSQFAAAELVECFGIDARRISVVPYGVDEYWLQPCAPEQVAATLATYSLRPGYFLFVGTLHPRKNISRLLDAWLALPFKARAQRQLVIVGALGWRCEALVARLCAALEADPLERGHRRGHAGAGARRRPARTLHRRRPRARRPAHLARRGGANGGRVARSRVGFGTVIVCISKSCFLIVPARPATLP